MLYCIFIVKLETGGSQDLKHGVYRITPLTLPPLPSQVKSSSVKFSQVKFKV